jgi:hypothetical protein
MDAARHWRTQVPIEHTDRYGCGALHVAAFEHRDDPGGPWRCIAVQVPETPRALFNEAMRRARQIKARIFVVGRHIRADRQSRAQDRAPLPQPSLVGHAARRRWRLRAGAVTPMLVMRPHTRRCGGG